MTNGSEWNTTDWKTRGTDILEAARRHGPQLIADVDGRFEIVFMPRRGTLEELFSKPGPIPDDDED